MAVVKWTLYLFFLITLWPLNGGDTVVCTLKKSCILPCRFNKGDKILVHWILPPDIILHSYYNDADQLDRQSQSFRGRTSMFHDQISNGNGSLKLTGVTLQDRGTYKCFTSTVTGKKVMYVNLEVEAPPSKVDIRQEGDSITCSSDKIYPRPGLTWSSNPPTSPTEDPTIKETDQLFSISSSVTVPNRETLNYICTISIGTSERRATWSKTIFPALITTSEATTTIQCPSLSTPPKSFSWRLNSEIILTKNATDASFKVTERWEKHVKDLSASGALTLEGLTKDKEGAYTCEVNTEEETSVKCTVLVIKEIPETNHDPAIGAGVAAGFLVAGLIAFIVIAYKKNLFHTCKKESQHGERGRPGQTIPLQQNAEE